MTLPLPNLDDRTYADLLAEARSLIPSEYPAWTDHNPSDSGIIMLELFAWLTEMLLYRVNQIPDRNLVAFLNLLNGDPAAAQPSDLPAAIQDTVLELRRRYRAVTTEDFEQLALHDWAETPEAKALGDLGKIQRVRCLPQVNLANLDPNTHKNLAPGHVSLVVVPPDTARRSVLVCNRLEDRVELPAIGINLNAFTVAFWVKLTGAATHWGVVSAVQRRPDQSWRLGDWWFLTQQTAAAQLGVKFGLGNAPEPALSATWTDPDWHHVAGTCDGTNLSLYLDGVTVATRPVSPITMPLAAGLVLYVAGSSFKAGSDRWDDLSGQNNHATKSANGEMPVLFTEPNHNGKRFPVLRFNSQSGMIFPNTLTVQKPFTAIIVDRYYGTVKGRTLQSRDNNWLLGKHGGNNGCYMEGWMGSAYAATPNVFTISTATVEGSSPAWYVNGELKASAGGTAAPGKLGLCKGGAYGAEVSEADIAAVLIWNRVLTPSERQWVERWLGQQYGIPIPPTAGTAVPYPATSPVQIGGTGTDTNRQGSTQRQIAAVSIWNRARQPAEIQADRLRQLTGQEPGLLGYWPLNEGWGQTATDRSPTRNSGTIVGASWAIAPNLLNHALHTALWSFLDQRRLLTTQHHVVEPEYVPVVLEATLRLVAGASSDQVQQQAIATVNQFFDPLTGGKAGQGWPFGRNVYPSEVYELLDTIPGVDYVETLKLQNTSPAPEVVLEDHQLVAIQFNPAQLTLREAWE